MTKLAAALLAGLLVVSACASNSDTSAGTESSDATDEPTAEPSGEATTDDEPEVQEFVSRPDLPAPPIEVDGDTDKAAPGLVFSVHQVHWHLLHRRLQNCLL